MKKKSRTSVSETLIERPIMLHNQVRATLTSEHYDPWEGSCTPEREPGEPPLMADAIAIVAANARLSEAEKMTHRELTEAGVRVELHLVMGDEKATYLVIETTGKDSKEGIPSFKGDGVLPVEAIDELIVLLQAVRGRSRNVEWEPKPVTPGLR